MKGYICLITNTVNNKKYIGQTFQEPLKRFKAHIYSSNRGSI